MPKLKLTSNAPQDLAVDFLALPVHQDELTRKKGRRPAVGAVVEAFGGVLEQVAKEEKFEGKAGQKLLLHTHGKISAARLLLVGIGEAADGVLAALRNAAGEAGRLARGAGAAKLGFVLPENADASLVQAAAEGVALGEYRFDKYFTDADAKKAPLKEAHLVLENARERSLKAAADLGLAIAEGVNFARDLVNEPAGVIYPETLAQAARDLGKAHGLKVTVKSAAEIKRLKMGMFSAVGQGSDHEPRFIIVQYQPKGRSKGKGVAFVGKGVTFDSGGYDLKPSASMLDMKIDMGGSAAALGAMRAVAAIKPPFPVTAYVGSVENLVSGRAFKPGDVLTSRKGKTVEINNTDAEGRLVLGDVLTYACEQGHDAIVDLATLTGACMVALGPYTFGGFTPNDDLADEIVGAARRAGEDVWRMPMNTELRDQLKSDIADLKNTGERFGGAITASLFLKEFVDETPWMHLDIAGPAHGSREKGVDVKGASGVGVRTLAQWVTTRAAK